MTSTTAAAWQAGEQWHCVKACDPTLSVQQLEATAVVLVCGLFQDEHLNIVTDSIFVARLCLAMAGPGVSTSAAALMLEEALSSRQGTVSVIHVNSHDPVKGYFQIGNDKADAAAKGVWTLQEARQLHESLHIGAKALAKRCWIPTADTKHVVATCPHCQKSPLWTSGVNLRGLKPSEIWQSDFTWCELLKPRAWLAVTVDTYSGTIIATQHLKTNSKATIQHWLTAMAWLGIPKQIKTDNGSNFTSKPVQEFTSKWGITLVQGIPYNSTGQTIVERANQTLKTKIEVLPKAEGFANAIPSGDQARMLATVC
uniref:RNA-directed DNA polymerase n=1 Tax=Junco hyemalis TaxID=40217 RepID=A0A8C5JF26_JUNHY